MATGVEVAVGGAVVAVGAPVVADATVVGDAVDGGGDASFAPLLHAEATMAMASATSQTLELRTDTTLRAGGGRTRVGDDRTERPSGPDGVERVA